MLSYSLLSSGCKTQCATQATYCAPSEAQLNDGSEAGVGNERDWGITVGECLALGLGSLCVNAASDGGDSGTQGGSEGGTHGSGNDSSDPADIAALIAHALENAEQEAAADSSGARGPLRLVIGRVADLQASGAIESDEYTLLDKLMPRIGSAQADWLRNAGVLRAELNSGITEIRDASPGDDGGQYLNAERNLLENKGWTFDPITNIWYAP